MTSLKDLKKFKGVDIDEFNGVKSIIEVVSLEDPKQIDFGDGMKETRQIKISSKVLNEGSETELRANEYVSVFQKNGVWGFSESPKSKAQKILTYFKVDNFEALQGKEIIINKKIKENGKEFLGFSYGA